MRRVFVAAAPSVRHLCPAHVVEGYEAEISEHVREFQFAGSVPRALGDLDPGVSPDDPAVVLVGRRTGGTMRGLPFWEVRRREDWP